MGILLKLDALFGRAKGSLKRTHCCRTSHVASDLIPPRGASRAIERAAPDVESTQSSHSRGVGTTPRRARERGKVHRRSHDASSSSSTALERREQLSCRLMTSGSNVSMCRTKGP